MKILLDMGHCLRGYDTGTQGYGKTEQACTREIGYKLKAKMEALGHTVIICSCDSSNGVLESLAYRVNTANNTGGDLYIAIHLNSGGGYGTEIFTYGAKVFAEATRTLDGFIALEFTNRGIKDGSHLYVIRNTKMKSMLVECCFMDTNDMKKYNADNFADCIVKGITGQAVNIPKPTAPTDKVTVIVKPSKPAQTNTGNDWIRRLQAECNKQGFSNQKIDGFYGENTLNGCPLMRQGARGKLTQLLQEKLNYLNYNTDGVDGIYGSTTRKAVYNYQVNHNLSADGICGKDTWREIIKQ